MALAVTSRNLLSVRLVDVIEIVVDASADRGLRDAALRLAVGLLGHESRVVKGLGATKGAHLTMARVRQRARRGVVQLLPVEFVQ